MNIPVKCPACGGKVTVVEISCPDCKTTVKGAFQLPLFAALSAEDEGFLKTFLSARGNIKEMERRLAVSYPTVKARLEALIGKLGLGETQIEAGSRRLEILQRLERGEISAPQAAALLKELEA